jgi:hypothetical protein
MQRVDERHAQWKALVKMADEAWASLREAQIRLDQEEMERMAAEAKSLDARTRRAYEELQLALADSRAVELKGEWNERTANSGQAQDPGWQA